MNYFAWNKASMAIKSLMFALLIFICHNQGLAQENPILKIPLVGAWAVDQSLSMAAVSPSGLESIQSSPEIRAKIVQGTLNRTFEFSSSGTFLQRDGEGNIVEGTWMLNGLTLMIKSNRGNLWTMEVLDLTQNKLILRQPDNGEFEPIFPILYLNKNL